MVHLILTGGSGLVGSGVLHAMLTNPAVTKISLLSRRPVAMAESDPKAELILHKDFSSYPPEVIEKLKTAQGCVWALGISQSEVSKEEYKKITLDYPLAFANAIRPSHSISNPFNFVYVAGDGTTWQPGRFTPYFGVIKGQAEQQLAALTAEDPAFRYYSVRPGGIDPRQHTEIHPFLAPSTTLLKKASPAILAAMNVLVPKLVTPTKPMGQVFTSLALGDGAPLQGADVLQSGRVLSNAAIRRLGGL